MGKDSSDEHLTGGRYIASEGSLDKVRQIADKLGVSLDREQTAHQAGELVTLYFADLRAVATDKCADQSVAAPLNL